MTSMIFDCRVLKNRKLISWDILESVDDLANFIRSFAGTSGVRFVIDYRRRMQGDLK